MQGKRPLTSLCSAAVSQQLEQIATARVVASGEVSPLEATDRLHHLITALPAGPSLVRVEQPIAATDPIAWLAAQSSAQKFYWAPRDCSDALAAIGITAQFDGPDLDWLDHLPNKLRWLITGRFDLDTEPDPEWSYFGVVRAYLPCIELSRRGDQSVLACHVWNSERETALTEVSRLKEAAAIAECHIQQPDVVMDQAWSNNVSAALDDIDNNRLRKVVLARKATVGTTVDRDPITILAALSKRHRETFRFCIQPAADHAFIWVLITAVTVAAY